MVMEAALTLRTPPEKAPEPDLGSDLIPKERYTSREFMELEWERMWTRVWNMAGREQDVPEPGDYFTTELGRESFLIVREKPGKGGLKGYYNVCGHRGNQLRNPGMGHAESFQCAYHHWEYNLDGSFKRIPDLETFPQGAPKRGLEELPCDTWGSFVWYSFDPNVMPLRGFTFTWVMPGNWISTGSSRVTTLRSGTTTSLMAA